MAIALTRRAATRRRVAWWGVVAGVLLAHAWLAQDLTQRLAALRAEHDMPPRIQVAYVRELMPAPPPDVAPAPPTPRPAARMRRGRPAAPPAAASAPESTLAQAATEEEAPPAAAEPDVAPASAPEVESQAEPQAPPEAAPSAASAPAPAASAAAPFEWPGSTRLSYQLGGNVRGEVHGEAQVEWIRQGSHYQVHLDVTIGLPIAPLITRHMSSDGELTSDGLSPRRYDEETKLAFRDPYRLTMRFERDWVVMPDGRRRVRPPGTQDAVSQFVQLSYLFTIQPERLVSGRPVQVILALPRHVDPWVYDVLGEEIVPTPFGGVAAFHLQPRRRARAGGDLVAEMWFSPQLRYLPVRIRIEQDPETYVDLVLARRPELAAP